MTTNLTQAGKTFTQNTKTLLGATDVSLDELAGFSGVSKSTLVRMETARKARRTYRPHLSTVVKLADLAGVSIDDFIKTRLNFA